MFNVCSTAPRHGIAKYASRCSCVFQQNVPTRSPSRTPSFVSAAASRSALSATSAKVARRAPPSVHVTHSLSAYTRRPWRRIAVMVSGKSCIVLAVMC